MKLIYRSKWQIGDQRESHFYADNAKSTLSKHERQTMQADCNQLTMRLC